MSTLFRRVLVPHDFSAPATEALRLARGLASPRSRIVVLHVLQDMPPIAELPLALARWPLPAERVAEATRFLQRLVRRVFGAKPVCRVDCRVVMGDASAEIIRAGTGHDSIVMATMGHGPLGRLLMGSVAEKVVRHASVPVITVRPRSSGTRSVPRRRRRAA